MKTSMKVVYLAALAAIFNSIFVYTDVMSKGWAIVASTLLSAILIEVIETMKRGSTYEHE